MSASKPAFDLNEQQAFLGKLEMITYFLWEWVSLPRGSLLTAQPLKPWGMLFRI